MIGCSTLRTAGRAGDPRLSLTRRQKRLLVIGRLTEESAANCSDRAIARELGVSQPFVSGLRRRSRPTTATAPAIVGTEAATVAALSKAPPGRYLERVTTAQEALDRAVAHRQLSRTRFRPLEPSRALTEWDPFD